MIGKNAKHKLDGYARHYDESRLWHKLSQMPHSSVLLVLEKVLLLRELLLAPGTPLWVRGIVVGALGYLILPFDLCPDLVPVAGYLDDVAMLGLALSNVDGLVTDDIRQRVRKSMERKSQTARGGGKP